MEVVSAIPSDTRVRYCLKLEATTITVNSKGERERERELTSCDSACKVSQRVGISLRGFLPTFRLASQAAGPSIMTSIDGFMITPTGASGSSHMRIHEG